MTLRLYLLLPLCAAAIYALAAICVKTGISRGAGSLAITFFSNLSMGLFFLPLLFFDRAAWNPSAVPWAFVAGALFFSGQIGTFRSLAAGDVSISTPVLASKVVFVALLSLPLASGRPDPDLWLAVALTMAGVVLLHRGPRHRASHPLATAAWALWAAASFAATDIVVQVQAPRTGFTLFVPVMFGTVALASVPFLLPRVLALPRLPARRGAWGWATAGILLLVVQSGAIAAAIGIFGDATGVNVVYSSRGLWSLLLVALLGGHLGASEAALDRRIFALRVLGGILILAAVVIVLF